MYIPSFFPICSAKLRLFYANQLKNSNAGEINPESKTKMEIFKDQALWDTCRESFYENMPQAVLQIVLILRGNIISSIYGKNTAEVN